MSRQVQIRRGTATAHTNFTGAIGEITMDTTNKTLRVHDGETVGGIKLAKQSEIPDLTNIDYVVESQLPTAENNYTWYRKYKSGWVEQGGKTATGTGGETVTLPIAMTDTNYTIICSLKRTNSDHGTGGFDRYPGTGHITTTSFWLEQPSNSLYFTCWTVSGFAAE